MLILNLSSEPYWLDLFEGVRLFVLPKRTSLMAEIREDLFSGMRGNDPEQGSDEASGEGLRIDGISYAKALARRVIQDWDGIGDAQGNPVEATPENIDALMEDEQAFMAFERTYMHPARELVAEGNGSAPALNGTTAGARNTAEPATDRARTARAGKPAR